MDKIKTGQKIKEIRKKNHLTQSQLADLLGYYDKSVIAHIEKDEAKMSYEKMKLFFEKLDIDANEFFGLHKKVNTDRLMAVDQDVLVEIGDMLFSYRVGGIIAKGDKILLSKNKDDYYIVGGHVQIGETSEETIIREFKEETGLDVYVDANIATYENFWKWNDKDCHQLCAYYRLKMKDENQEIISNPDNVNTTFIWFDINKLDEIKLYPLGIAKIIKDNQNNAYHHIMKQK